MRGFMRSGLGGSLAVALCAALLACGGGGESGGTSAPASSSSSVTSAASSSQAASSVGSSVGSSSSSSVSSAVSSSASSSSVSSASSSIATLSQDGNPIYAELNTYKSWLSTSSDTATALAADTLLADNMMTWQMPHGGFYKNAKSVYAKAWDGSAARSGWTGAGGVELGTIDNDATVTEILFLANVYQRTQTAKYRDAARKAMDFILGMQYASGGFPQVYPARTGTTYSNYVTFNDDAMVRVLVLLDHALQKKAPLNDDFFTTEQQGQLASAIDKAVGFILKAQIKQDGKLTVWCAQHDPVTYVPKEARAYELPSKSGKESVLVTAFLMSRPQTAEVAAAVKGALAWYNSSAVKVADTAYVNRASGSTDDTYNPIQAKAGSTMWYRFYEVTQDKGFFSDRTGGTFYDIMEIEAERRYGYQWGGSYGATLFDYAKKAGVSY